MKNIFPLFFAIFLLNQSLNAAESDCIIGFGKTPKSNNIDMIPVDEQSKNADMNNARRLYFCKENSKDIIEFEGFVFKCDPEYFQNVPQLHGTNENTTAANKNKAELIEQNGVKYFKLKIKSKNTFTKDNIFLTKTDAGKDCDDYRYYFAPKVFDIHLSNSKLIPSTKLTVFFFIKNPSDHIEYIHNSKFELDSSYGLDLDPKDTNFSIKAPSDDINGGQRSKFEGSFNVAIEKYPEGLKQNNIETDFENFGKKSLEILKNIKFPPMAERTSISKKSLRQDGRIYKLQTTNKISSYYKVEY